ATGGLSIPKIGATDFAFRLAKQFALKIVAPRAGLVPLTFDAAGWQPFVPLAGVSLPVEVETGVKKARGWFKEDPLFTHRGLSGPAILQISSYWQDGAPLTINLAPETDIAEVLIEGKATSKKNLGNQLAQWLPSRLADEWLLANGFRPDARVADMQDRQLRQLGAS